MVQRPDSEDMEGGSSAAEGQVAVSQTEASLCFYVDAVFVQLCSSDGVEDLLESLAIDSPKSLTSQEPEGHHRVSPAADHLQGEHPSPLCINCLPSVSPASSPSHTSSLRSGLGPGFGSSSDAAAGVLSGQPADQKR